MRMGWDGWWCVCRLFYPCFLLFHDQEAQVNVNLFCFWLVLFFFLSYYNSDCLWFCRFLCLSLSFNADVCCVDVILSTYVDAFILYLVALTVNFMTVHCSLCLLNIFSTYIYVHIFHFISLELNYMFLLFFDIRYYYCPVLLVVRRTKEMTFHEKLFLSLILFASATMQTILRLEWNTSFLVF